MLWVTGENFIVSDWVVEDRNRRLNNSDTDDYGNRKSISSAEFMKELEKRALEKKQSKKTRREQKR